MTLTYLDIIKQARRELECRKFFIGKLGKVSRLSVQVSWNFIKMAQETRPTHDLQAIKYLNPV